MVKTTLRAKDPLLRGEGREETMGLPGLLGGGDRGETMHRLGGGDRVMVADTMVI